jgi:hypothetical protein
VFTGGGAAPDHRVQEKDFFVNLINRLINQRDIIIISIVIIITS